MMCLFRNIIHEFFYLKYDTQCVKVWKSNKFFSLFSAVSLVGQSEAIRSKYCSDYGVIADYLAYYNDRRALEGYLKNEKRKLVHVEQVLDMLEAFSSDKRFQLIKQRYMTSENREECDNMCLLLDMCEERGIERGIERGMKEKAQSIARNLLGILDNSTIATVTGLSVEAVEQLADE